MISAHKKNLADILGRDPIHPFPARMAPGIALEILESMRSPIRVLDPMSGSGTVVAVARAKGHHAVGIDIDPLAVLMSRVWVTPIEATNSRECAIDTLQRAKRRFVRVTAADAYPLGSDEATRAFIRYWFDPSARRQLACLALEISKVNDQTLKDFLWCAFSRLIITKQSGASRASDLAHSRPHRSYATAPIEPFSKFFSAAERVAANCISTRARGRGPAARIIQGDARKIPLASSSIDLVLTSPPYLNAIDYMRCSKFSLVWMGYRVGDLRGIRARSVGTEVGLARQAVDGNTTHLVAELGMSKKLGERHKAILARYIVDMCNAVNEVARLLRPSGTAVYVVGENTIRGNYVRTSKLITSVASLAGLRLRERHVRTLPANRRYLPPPSRLGEGEQMNARMRREVVLAFEHLPRRISG